MAAPPPLSAPRLSRWGVVGGLAAAAFGWGVWEAGARSLPEADAARWTLRASTVPVEVPGSAGPLRLDPAALDLWAYRGATPNVPAFSDGELRLTARVPDDGQLLVRLGAEAASGPTLPVHPGGPNRPGLPSRGPGDGGPGGGNSGGNSGPGGGNGGPGGGNGGGSGAPAGASAAPPRPAEQGVTLIIDRSARNSITGKHLRCDPAPAPPERFTLDLTARGGTLAVAVDGREVTRCTGTWGPGAVVVGAGIRRVQVTDVTVNAGGVAFADSLGGPLRSRLAGAIFALVGAVLGSRLRRPGYALALLPALLLPVFGRLDMRAALDTLRLLAVPEALGPALFCGLPTAALVALVAGARAGSMRAAGLRGLAGLAAGGLVGLVTARSDLLGWVLLGGLAVPLAALAWVNTHPFARRVGASYTLTALLLCGGEGAVRLTALDETWTRTAGWRRAADEFSELIELQRYRAYPDEGFPVRPPERDPSRRRVLALGGSSTGGAWQMDDLSQFWPRRLEEQLPGWEVVNQGVGGWNTLHIRLYLESQMERLDPDVVVLYVGHNDVLATAPVPYRELYASWKQGGGAPRVVVDTLNRSRLYVGLKYGLLALAAREGAVAVPVSDARDNLAAIARLAAERGAHTLFVTEGLNPDPLPMRPYGAMLTALAADTDNRAFDAADALWRAGDPDLFLDDCHLSVRGHTTLAGWIAAELRASGWLEAAR